MIIAQYRTPLYKKVQDIFKYPLPFEWKYTADTIAVLNTITFCLK